MGEQKTASGVVEGKLDGERVSLSLLLVDMGQLGEEGDRSRERQGVKRWQ